jgi:hypothetical protein
LRAPNKYRSLAHIALGTLLLACATIADAADLYLVRFNAVSRTNACTTVNWHDEAMFFNSGIAPATIRVLGVSQGQPAPGAPDSFVVAPGSAVALDDALGRAWSGVAQLYVMHLDVPQGVRVASRNEVYSPACLVFIPSPGALGQVALPVFTALTIAGVPQVHLGTDLGQLPSRTNVGIYNGGDVAAQARIELRRVCDNIVVDERTVTVPANATVQVGPLSPGVNTCTTSSQSEWLRYTVVIVDQPSLTFVSNIRETLPNAGMGFIPTVDLAMAAGSVQF